MDILKDTEFWAVSREQESHREALQLYGEKVLVRQPWRWLDFENGDVGRCSVCSAGYEPDVQQRMSAVYQQSGDSRCDSCYGTGYEGGFKPVVFILQSFIRNHPEEIQRTKFGIHVIDKPPSAQFLWEPKVMSGDLLVRAREWDEDTPVIEYERYVLDTVKEETVRTGNRIHTYNRPADEARVISQTADLHNVTVDHPYREVPVT